MSLDPGTRVDITSMKLVFCINLLSTLEYSFDAVVLDSCLDSSSVTWFDFPRIGTVSKSNMAIRSINNLVSV